MASRFTRNLRDPETGKFSGKAIWIRFRGTLAVLLSLALLGSGGWYVYTHATQWWTQYTTATDYTGDGAGDVEVTIPMGTALSQISQILADADVVKTAKAFDQVVAAAGDPTIQAGTYKLKKQIPAQKALDMLLDKANVIHNTMRIPEGRWLSDAIKVMADKTGLPGRDFEKLLNTVPDPAKIGLPTWFPKGKSAEGYVFPDTYEMPDKPTVAVIVNMTTKRFSDIATEVDLEGRAKALKQEEKLKTLTPNDLVIIASIIEREVNRDGDRAKVARVVYNRIKKGMPLQMDSTLMYFLKKTSGMEMTKKELDSDTPYNTRKYKGLPPTPISNPGQAALEAAANPESGDWLYFVVVNPMTGETEFSVTPAEFEVSKAKYKSWCEASDANRKVCYG